MNGLVLDSISLHRGVARMAHEIAERNSNSSDLVLVGVQKGGVALAKRLSIELERILGHAVPLGILDVALYRDDLAHRVAPEIQPTLLPCDPTGHTVVLVDDVLFTGRTTRAAMDALHDLGRPRQIQLAVLIDRGHRELPIRPDFVGKNIPTSMTQRIDVRLIEDGGDDTVLLVEAKP